MNFNNHSDLVGQHAYLSPSKYHWINYSDEKMEDTYMHSMAAQRGTEIHDFAMRAIRLGFRLPKTNTTVNAYVNDGIGFKMKTEQVLFYSYNSFGTVDAISFKKNVLRIHDLKTGISPAHMSQLEVYVALFCLEYGFKPENIKAELRLYQSDKVLVHIPKVEETLRIMDIIVRFDKKINSMKIDTED